jgi:hypothetical protein
MGSGAGGFAIADVSYRSKTFHAGHEARRRKVTHSGLAARKDDAAQHGVGSPNGRLSNVATAPLRRVEPSAADATWAKYKSDF